MKLETRIKALESAYDQLIAALNEKLDTKEVEPEKRKTAMSMYRQAQEDSRKMFDELIELKELVLVTKEEFDLIELHRPKRSAGLSPEER